MQFFSYKLINNHVKLPFVVRCAVYIFFYCVFFLFSCGDPEKVPLAETKEMKDPLSDPLQKTVKNIHKYWPEGTFIQYFKDNHCAYIEKWIASDKNTRVMHGVYIQLNPVTDTLFQIWGRLVCEKDNVRLSYKTSSDEKEIDFVLSKNDENVFVFENPFRTFPSIMKYSFLSDTCFEVLERGFREGREEEVIYNVKKLK